MSVFLATSGTISVSSFLVFARLRYGISSNDYDKSDKVSGKGNGKFRGFLFLLVSLECSFMLLE